MDILSSCFHQKIHPACNAARLVHSYLQNYFHIVTYIISLHVVHVNLFQYGNVGAMAITLCQSLGQNIGMRWNNARNSAGKKEGKLYLQGPMNQGLEGTNEQSKAAASVLVALRQTTLMEGVEVLLSLSSSSVL